MALTVFLLFGVFVISVGLVYSYLTLRHHREIERANKEASGLARADALAGERLP